MWGRKEWHINFGHDMLQEKYVDVRSIIEKCHIDRRRYIWSQEIFWQIGEDGRWSRPQGAALSQYCAREHRE